MHQSVLFARTFKGYSLGLTWLLIAALVGTTPGRSRADDDAVSKLTSAYQRGMALYHEERYADAIPAFEEAVQLAPRVYGRGNKGVDNMNTARLTEFLANCHSESYRLSEAESLYEKCLAAVAAEEGRNSPMHRRCQGSLASVYFRLNQWSEAEKLYLASLEANDLSDDGGVRASNLAYLYLTMGRQDAALAWFRQALNHWEQKHDRRGQLMKAQVWHGMGMIAYQRNQLHEAQQRFEQALAERTRWLPLESRWVAQTQGMLASVYSSQGKDVQAKKLAEQAEKAYRIRSGADSTDVALQLHELALLLARQGDDAAAIQRMSESRRIYRKYMVGVLTGLSSAEQLRFLAEERRRYMDAIALARQHANDPTYAHASLEWVFNEKGLMQQALAERTLQARDVHFQPDLTKIVQDLNDVRQRLAAVAAAGDDKPELSQQLSDQANDLERRLARMNRRRASEPQWLELSHVLDGLPANSVLIHLVRIDRATPAVSAFGARPAAEPYYVAWTLRKSDARVRLFDLGPAELIEAQVAAVRQSLAQAMGSADDPESIFQLGDAEAELRALRPLDALSRSIFHPLRSELAGSQHLIVSPDGALWLTPWAALRTPEGRYAIEEYQLEYAIRGQTTPPSDAIATNPAVVMADPNFDLTPTQAESSLRAIYRGAPAPRTVAVRSVGKLSDIKPVPRLPATAAEARAITPSLKALTGRAPTVYTQHNALESVFRRLRRPEILVLSTHGFFLEGSQDRNGDSALEEENMQNPLLRCGLLLAGCNQRESQRGATSEEGVLTGLEILGADLRGAKLVVLSACETGLGQVRSNEGVAGLRQAFQLAGAETVVSTLWVIPDRESAVLMSAFFENLVRGQSYPEALTLSQRQLIAQLREKREAAHPAKWAAYTITQK